MINLIKVDAIDSTNTFLKEGVRNGSIVKPTCIWARKQLKGRGQRDALWKSESGKNLTFSVYTPVSKDLAKYPITINLLTALAIQLVLKKHDIPKLKIKWPNDIMSAKKKIGGILIENTYLNGVFIGSIIGIGLNVNQEIFEGLPQASSLKRETMREFDLNILIQQLLLELEKSILNYSSKNFFTTKQVFEEALFLKGTVTSFRKASNGVIFNGIIQGITENGELRVLEENDKNVNYSLKELQLLY